MMISLLFTSVAMAWPTNLPPIDQRREKIDSPLGRVDKAMAYSACLSESPFVGKITNVVPFRKFPERGPIYSILTFEVELDIKGTLGPTVQFMVPGGTINGTTMVPGPHQKTPRPTLGARYAVALGELEYQPTNDEWQKGDLYAMSSLHFTKPDSDLPPLSTVVDAYTSFCGGLQ